MADTDELVTSKVLIQAPRNLKIAQKPKNDQIISIKG
jgi:hypothetical protein